MILFRKRSAEQLNASFRRSNVSIYFQLIIFSTEEYIFEFLKLKHVHFHLFVSHQWHTSDILISIKFICSCFNNFMKACRSVIRTCFSVSKTFLFFRSCVHGASSGETLLRSFLHKGAIFYWPIKTQDSRISS